MATLRFMATIRIQNSNPYLLVSAAQATTLKRDWRMPLPVLVRINELPEVPWRINLMPVGDGSFYLYLDGVIRKATDTKVGDQVRAEVQFDAAYRGGPLHRMPSWFRTALTKNPKAKANWDALIPSRKKEILRYFSRLKSREARERNCQRALQVLSGGKGRFMARLWNDGVEQTAQ